MIVTENLSYEYKTTFEENGKSITKKILALNNINIEIEKGSFVAVLGHNGSGKSTLAKHINALVRPTEGTLWINGYDTKNEEFLWDIRQSAGMVFQNPDNQIVATIVEEDVAFGPENLGIEPSEIRKRVDEAIATVHMQEYRKSVPSKLSGGQKQRIAIAGVLAMKPECIVLDEPTAMLDPEGRRDVINTITRLNREEKLTTVLITHYMDETVGADRIIVIDDGNIVMDGTPREVLVQVEKMKSFGLEVPQATEIAYNLRKRGIDIPADILTPEEMVGAICQLKSAI
ncbi:energy-coupling factor transporter ATPase [Lachnospiraceae bacterium NSJ-143]|nr:energy-coupling factor transporter ATPase [Lachnospiraceae bacterium NSJ-143]